MLHSSFWKNIKAKECQDKLRQLQWKEKGKEEAHVEEGLNITEIKNRQEMIRGRREWRNIAFDGNVHNGM